MMYVFVCVCAFVFHCLAAKVFFANCQLLGGLRGAQGLKARGSSANKLVTRP